MVSAIDGEPQSDGLVQSSRIFLEFAIDSLLADSSAPRAVVIFRLRPDSMIDFCVLFKLSRVSPWWRITSSQLLRLDQFRIQQQDPMLSHSKPVDFIHLVAKDAI